MFVEVLHLKGVAMHINMHVAHILNLYFKNVGDLLLVTALLY